jgi:succinyl-CoA synthetase beta subunit
MYPYAVRSGLLVAEGKILSLKSTIRNSEKEMLLKLYEYQAKQLFSQRKIPIPEGTVCETPGNVRLAYEKMDGNVVLKSQVLVGGRGKAGGIKFPRSADEAYRIASEFLSKPLKGVQVERVLVERRLDIDKEYYLGVITDTDHACPLLMFSSEGGMDIEELARTRPDSIKRVLIDPFLRLPTYKVRQPLKEAGLPASLIDPLIRIAVELYSLYWDMDGELIEINPLVITRDGKPVAADGKFNIDNSALYRQPLAPKPEQKSVEARAAAVQLSYVQLDGNIGIISNGAGLTMATMDHIHLEGGKPANFLDCGQRIMEQGVKNGLDFILESPKVTAIFINIFAGGPRCDIIAQKIIEAVDELESQERMRVPVVVCLQGRFVEEGRRILATSKSKMLEQADTIEEAVRRTIKLGAQK